MKKLDTGIAYADEGSGDEVLLLHGSLSADWFGPVGRRLVEDGYRALPACWRTRAHIVGHSSGCTVALQLALEHPNLVRSLVLVEPTFPYASDEPRDAAGHRGGA
jgi:pimeloyl-ACP methyl ester carboxylesterase